MSLALGQQVIGGRASCHTGHPSAGRVNNLAAYNN